MKKLIIIIAVLLLCKSGVAQNVSVVPTPQSVEVKQGHFQVKSKNVLFYFANNEGRCADMVEKTFTNEGYDFSDWKMECVATKKKLKKKNYVELVIDSALTFEANAKQGYVLDICADVVKIKAQTEQGLFYGLQTFKQLLVAALVNGNVDDVNLDCMTITDYPALEYRGWMDDISRGPVPNMEFLKREIRTMAANKMNFFNLYTEHVFKLNSHPDIAPADGLTAAEIKELTDYAAQYYVEFIGNQQCFAHAEKTLRIPYYWNICDTRYNLNPGTDETYSFLEEMFAEVAPAYKSSYFNINCDETEGLGAGRAKEHVAAVGGADNAYCLHVNNVYDILKKYDKTVMMWGDIIAKNPEMIKKLPRDMHFIVWSYVAADNFYEHIDPIKESGHPFWIAPGMSMWSTLFPLVNTYMKNIANLVRDGHAVGTKGMMNTAWDDSGESLFNSAWHGMAWAAEMSWKPISNKPVEVSDKEREQRENVFNAAFNKQYFNTKSDATQLLYEIGNLNENPDIADWMNTGTLYEPLLDFYPSKIDESVITRCNNVLATVKPLVEKCDEVLANTEMSNVDIFLNARYALKRIEAMACKNMLRVQLYKTFQNPIDANIEQSKKQIAALVDDLKQLKYDYLQLWDYECRQYSRDIVTSRFDALALELLEAENHVFINTELSAEGVPVLSLKTLYSDRPIYYTIDGGKPSKVSNIYTEPFAISQSCEVKAVSYNSYGDSKQSQRYILYHKGMGHLKQINTEYSKYNATYSAGGDNALLDGVVGADDSYRDGHWQGYWGVDVDVEMDLGKPTQINMISMRFIQNTFDWILAPKMVEVYTSVDGKEYKLLKQEELQPNFHLSGNVVNPVSVRDLNTKTRYLRVVAKNPGLLPQWHPAKGNQSYLFVDEIVVE